MSDAAGDNPGTAETHFALRGRTARQLMTPSPHMVFETDPLETAAEILARFSAVAVVDLERCVVGVLSRTDLARIFGLKHSVQSAALTLEGRDEAEASGLEYKPPAKRVSEVMTPHVLTAPADTPASEIVGMLGDKRIGRVFIIDDERHLIGVVSTSDFIAKLRPLV
jgi:CBS domain-containing membrane protein